MDERDEVILVDDHGRPIGTALKSSVHGADTALHLAFSCHVYNADGQILVTRRALGKKTWPGVWTNSFCGHPRPGESVPSAIQRHARHELGIEVTVLTVALPRFRYRAVDAAGIVEHEICPVYTARTDQPLSPNPLEVAETRWADPDDLAASLERTPWAFSPWLVLQAEQLDLSDSAAKRRRAS